MHISLHTNVFIVHNSWVLKSTLFKVEAKKNVLMGASQEVPHLAELFAWFVLTFWLSVCVVVLWQSVMIHLLVLYISVSYWFLFLFHFLICVTDISHFIDFNILSQPSPWMPILHKPWPYGDGLLSSDWAKRGFGRFLFLLYVDKGPQVTCDRKFLAFRTGKLGWPFSRGS